MTEGRKMFGGVMIIFILYAAIFIIFEDYDRKYIKPFNEDSDWHLLYFSIFVMAGLAFILHKYAKRMDERISKEQTEKENMIRRELTQNISHELKTPVASILGYTDTILDTPDIPAETMRTFITRTNEQAKRLTALLQDLSTLNQMNYAPEILTRERVNVSKIVSDISMETSLQLSRKEMSINNYLPVNIIIRGNHSLVYSIFSNLIDNAINYAGTGTAIDISAMEKDEHWTFTVKDNGTGIEEQHLKRIFERFYRVDKSRSRQLGGTGLGLAIVKNAVLLHHGKIEAMNNTDGKGVSFEFSLRKR